MHAKCMSTAGEALPPQPIFDRLAILLRGNRPIYAHGILVLGLGGLSFYGAKKYNDKLTTSHLGFHKSIEVLRENEDIRHVFGEDFVIKGLCNGRLQVDEVPVS